MLTRFVMAAVMMSTLLIVSAVSAKTIEPQQEAGYVNPYAGYRARYVADRTQAVQTRTRLVSSRVVYVNRTAYPPRAAYARDTRARIVRNPAFHQPATTTIEADDVYDYQAAPNIQHEEYVVRSQPYYSGARYKSNRAYRAYPGYGYNGAYSGYGHYGGYPSYGYSRHGRGHYGYGSHYGRSRGHFGYGISYGHYGGHRGGHHYGYGHRRGGHHYGSGVSIYFRF